MASPTLARAGVGVPCPSRALICEAVDGPIGIRRTRNHSGSCRGIVYPGRIVDAAGRARNRRVKLPVRKECKVCGSGFEAAQERTRFCSPPCRRRYEYDRKLYRHACIVCAKEFESRQHSAFCCSTECTRRRILAGLDAGRAKRRKFVDVADRWRDANHRRRAKTDGQEHISSREIFIRDGWRCGLCGKKINRKMRHPHPASASLDHIIPISVGGVHAKTNVQCAHLGCNSRKQAGAGGQLLLFG